MIQLPENIADEATLLHQRLRDRGQLDINQLLHFLSKIAAARNKKPSKKKQALFDDAMFQFQLDGLSRGRVGSLSKWLKERKSIKS